jgi:hypothetical protein
MEKFSYVKERPRELVSLSPRGLSREFSDFAAAENHKLKWRS